MWRDAGHLLERAQEMEGTERGFFSQRLQRQ